jgi:glutathione S-transferase
MTDLVNDPAFRSYAVCSVILAVKMLLSGSYTTAMRLGNKGFVNDEDAKAFGAAGANAVEQPAVAHALRIQRNDGENIPIFFAIGLIYVLSGASAFGAAAYCWTFTIARLLHTVF